MKIGIVGCGGVAQTHAAILRTCFSTATLVFCDRNEEKADRLARRFSSGSTYSSIEELLKEEHLDAVHILTQVQGHAALAEQALAAGVHTYIEKPVTERLSEYERLVALATANGRCLCAGYSALGMPAVRTAKDLIASGGFGRLVAVHCDFNWSSPGDSIPYGRADHWAYALKGGILQNLADHPTSIVVDVLDDVVEHRVLSVRRTSLPNDNADLLHVAMSNDGQIGSYTVSFGHGNTHAQVVYSLESGSILADLRRQIVASVRGKGPQKLSRKASSGMRLGWQFGIGTVANVVRTLGRRQSEPGIAELIANFYRAIDGQAQLLVTDRTATKVIALLEEVWEEAGSDPAARGHP
jgi:predicted dehydrogenase